MKPAEAAVERVNSMKPAEQKDEMDRLGLQIRGERETEEAEGASGTSLMQVKGGPEVRPRTPSGPLHIGHARGGHPQP